MIESPTSAIDSRFVLPDDVLFVPIDELVDSVRAQLGGQPGDQAITRPGFRVPTRLVDADTAALLKSFRPASNIVDAVLQFSKERQVDPEAALADAFEVLQLFARSSILVEEGSAQSTGLVPSAAPGQRVDRWEVEAVIQVTHDTELYRVKGPDGKAAALKIAREHAPEYAADAVAREAQVLQRLDGAIGPTLIGHGSWRGRAWLAVRWIAAVPVTVRAAELRRRAAPGWRQRLLRLGQRVADAMARVHEFGVLHGDIHPRNILVDGDDNVYPIDFGVSRVPSGGPGLDHDTRAATGWYLDPETAAALSAGHLPDAVTHTGEQYATAAVIFELLCGHPHLEVALEVAAMNRNICESPTQPFSRVGFEPWPQVEAVLQRALTKDPYGRYPDLRSFSKALSVASLPGRDRLATHDDTLASKASRPYLRGPAASLQPTRRVFDDGPIAGLDHGAAGLAWYYWRLATLQDSPRLLALADIWARRAEVEKGDARAWHQISSPSEGFAIDGCSVLHRAPGVALIRALIALSRGDTADATTQVDAFVAYGRPSHGVADLTLGAAGILASGCTLVDALLRHGQYHGGLLQLLTEHAEALTALLSGPAGEGLQPRQPLSLAHGWVGPTYALLRARWSLGLGDDPLLRRRLDTLSAAAHHQSAVMPGWCNGPAGQVHALLLGHRHTPRQRWIAAAEHLGEEVAHHPDRHGHLCCGLAGRIFALLALYQHTGESRWHDFARALGRQVATARWPAEGRSRPHSLFWGPLGAALALEELRQPERACMPVFAAVQF